MAQQEPEPKDITFSVITELGHGVSTLLKLLQKLRSFGLDRDVDLPRIIFVGKQSAGKSSIVEAVTTIQLPRASQTCTRCPIEVRTSKGQCRCKVSLRRELGEDGSPLSSPVVEHFKTLNDETERKDQAKVVKEAQEKLLGEGDAKQRFTKNTVCVDICGPKLLDLAITDMPGLIEVTADEKNDSDVECVKSLTREHMEKQNTVIVQCLPADEDMENHGVVKLSREADKTGLRTISVFTKPDKVEDGPPQHEFLQKVANNVVLGGFVVRTRTAQEMKSCETNGLQPEEAFQRARAVEANFFRSTLLGRRLKGQNPDRCGVKLLRNRLSQLLFGMMEKQMRVLPELIREQKKQAAEELSLKKGKRNMRA